MFELVRLANTIGSFAITVEGNIEGFPTLKELNYFLESKYYKKINEVEEIK